ncbi:MAG: glycosyltransferase family 4 protein, partial [Candidatus Peribacteraceae bacterium]|nr:glycosyltransferase family 4 protein [Candidatus Peribacteraceae bacterium]
EKITEHAGCEYPISIIHNGVDVDRFQKDVPDIRSQYAGKKVLLTVGGLKERKGQDIVIRALQKIRQQREDVVYVLVGEGNWKPGLQKLAEELGVADAVDFVGSKKGDELVSLYNACDVYVHTPKVVDLNFEGFGIVYLEASACGKPIVATDAGGIRDAVVDGKTGLIAPDGDVDAVAKHILSLVDSPELALQMGEAGKVYARAHDWSDIAKQYLDHYNQIHP